MTNREKVLARYPGAEYCIAPPADGGDSLYWIRKDPRDTVAISHGRTESEAWARAAKRIEQKQGRQSQ